MIAVRKKKARPKATAKRKTVSEKFVDLIDVQLRLAKGEKVNQGRGTAASWMQDGNEYGVGKVLIPRIGRKPVWDKIAFVVNTKQPKPPTNELQELRREVVAGRYFTKLRLSMPTRKRKKK